MHGNLIHLTQLHVYVLIVHLIIFRHAEVAMLQKTLNGFMGHFQTQIKMDKYSRDQVSCVRPFS